MPLLILLLIFVAVSIGLVWFMLSRDHGPKEPIMFLWLAVGLGFLGALAAGWLEGRLLDADNLLPGTPHGALLVTAMGVGIIEETVKFVPLAAVLYRQKFFNEHTDGVIYFALAGLGFGLPENIMYTMEYGTDTGIMRLMLTPIFHAAMTGMIGYHLARRKLAGKPALGISWVLLFAMSLHGLYNFGLVAGTPLYAAMSLTITLGLSASLFVLFLQAAARDEKLGMSAIGHNQYCRTCGHPNPHHHLYCTHCGKNA